jgi:hypothetical protein
MGGSVGVGSEVLDLCFGVGSCRGVEILLWQRCVCIVRLGAFCIRGVFWGLPTQSRYTPFL